MFEYFIRVQISSFVPALIIITMQAVFTDYAHGGNYKGGISLHNISIPFDAICGGSPAIIKVHRLKNCETKECF